MTQSHLPGDPDPIRRRDFLLGIAATGLGAAGGRSVEKGADPDPDVVDLETLRAASRLSGLAFTDEELKAALDDLRREWPRWRTSAGLPNGVAPTLGRVDAPCAREPSSWKPSRELDDDIADEEASGPLHYQPAYVLAHRIRKGEITSLALTRHFLERMKRLDPKLLCVVTLLEERALAQARAADADLAAGRVRSALHGVPWGVKDLFSVPGAPTTWGAAPFEHQVLDETAEVVARLDAAGCVLLAKLSTGALAMGDRWFRGRTRNPWNLEQGSSGSSAGPASATAAGLVGFAIGTETLGSIVSPCTRCGTTGLRPTFGRVSRAGAMALSWSMDKAGPIARSIRDAELVLEIIAGADPKDVDTVARDFASEVAKPLAEIRVGRVDLGGRGRRDAEAYERVLKEIDALGFRTRPVTLPRPDRRMMAILDVEAAAAFDDITRDGRVRELTAQGPGSWPRIFRAARFIPGVEYVQACRMRTALKARMREAMAEIDVLVIPSYAQGILLTTNLTGHPTAVMPRRAGAGRSISFVGRLWGERNLARLAHAWQTSTSYHRAHPNL